MTFSSTMYTKRFLSISPLLLCAALAGCSHGAYSRAAIGRLTLSLRAQSLGGAKRAVLELAGMRLQRAGAGPLIYNFRPPHVVMLAHDGKGDDDLLLYRQTLPAGTYTGVTLMLDPAQGGVDSFAEMPGGRLQVLKTHADGEELTVERSFNVPSSGRRHVVLGLWLRDRRAGKNGELVSMVSSLTMNSADHQRRLSAKLKDTS